MAYHIFLSTRGDRQNAIVFVYIFPQNGKLQIGSPHSGQRGCERPLRIWLHFRHRISPSPLDAPSVTSTHPIKLPKVAGWPVSFGCGGVEDQRSNFYSIASINQAAIIPCDQSCFELVETMIACYMHHQKIGWLSQPALVFRHHFSMS